MTIVRRAAAADAFALVELAESVGREDGRWILGTGPWRSVSDERRYLRTIHRHPDAAVFVACLLYTSPSPRDISGSRMPSSA